MPYELKLNRERAALLRIAVEFARADCRASRRVLPPGSDAARQAAEFDRVYGELLAMMPPLGG